MLRRLLAHLGQRCFSRRSRTTLCREGAWYLLIFAFATTVAILGGVNLLVVLAGMLRRMKPFVFYPAGGTAAVTVRQVGEALAGALETNRGGNAIPLGMANLTWKKMLASFQDGMGLPRRPVVTVPVWAFALAGAAIKLQKKRQGLEGGLDLPRFARAMSREMFIMPEEGALSLGVTPDDIDAAIAQSARASADALDGKARLVGMQGEKT